MLKPISIFFLLLFIIGSNTFAQDHRFIDSVSKILPKKANSDTTKPLLMGLLAFEYSYIDLDSGMAIAQEALKLSKNLKHDRSTSSILNTIGTIHHDKGNYAKAIEAYTEASKLAEKEHDYDMIAVIYANQGNTHNLLGDFKKARYYLFESAEMFKKAGKTHRLTPSYLNIGSLYYDEVLLDSALYYYDLALKYPTNQKGHVASVHVSKAFCYRERKQYKEAEKECLIAIDIAKELKSDYYYFDYASELAILYFETNRMNEAEKLLLASQAYFKKASLLDKEMKCHDYLYKIYFAQKNYEKALLHHVEHARINDSLNSAETNKAARELEKKYQEEKRQAQIEKLNAEKQASETEVKRKGQLLLFAIIGVIIVLIVLVFAIYAFINKRKANFQLQQLNKEVSIQKNELYDKNKSITDSILYAHRIQKALLASDKSIENGIQDYFILYQPKDIVSGDFYWALNQGEDFYFVLADCTGHGVPGAFMSLLGISYLNDLVQGQKLSDTGVILNELRNDIIHALNDNNTENYQMKDGMDGVLIKYNKRNKTLQYSAANNKIIVIRKNEIIELKGEKMPIGRSPKEEEQFKTYTFNLMEGDMIYLFTDGFPDQFGGEKGKKLKEKNLKELICKNNQLPLANQRESLLSYLKKWQGDLEQIDDICLVGFKIS